MSYLSNAGNYLFDTIFNLFLIIVLLRFWMQWVRANFRNEFGQFLLAVSNPVIIPLRKIVPSIGPIDTATVVLAILLVIFKYTLLPLLSGSAIPWGFILAYCLGELIKYSVYIFMAAIVIQIIASWVAPYSHHPLLDIAKSIAEPLMAPARRLLPSVGGIDFSPIIVFIFLNLTLMLIVAPLQSPY